MLTNCVTQLNWHHAFSAAGDLLNDLWKLDPPNASAGMTSKVVWTKLITASGDVPAGRMGHGFAAEGGALYVYSGQDYSGELPSMA
jgi:hypothetical protein